MITTSPQLTHQIEEKNPSKFSQKVMEYKVYIVKAAATFFFSYFSHSKFS
jgi:hypothetical protein